MFGFQVHCSCYIDPKNHNIHGNWALIFIPNPLVLLNLHNNHPNCSDFLVDPLQSVPLANKMPTTLETKDRTQMITSVTVIDCVLSINTTKL